MLYLVDVTAGMDRANEIDAKAGPGPTLQKIAERFRPQSFWGVPSQRRAIMIVELKGPTDMAELMYALTWFTGGQPSFTPLSTPEIFDQAIAAAKKLTLPPG
jgi:hypothetical protein